MGGRMGGGVRRANEIAILAEKCENLSVMGEGEQRQPRQRPAWARWEGKEEKHR